jgi:hypothetical protein
VAEFCGRASRSSVRGIGQRKEFLDPTRTPDRPPLRKTERRTISMWGEQADDPALKKLGRKSSAGVASYVSTSNSGVHEGQSMTRKCCRDDDRVERELVSGAAKRQSDGPEGWALTRTMRGPQIAGVASQAAAAIHSVRAATFPGTAIGGGPIVISMI